jgi:lipoprotein-anchoring transpeptidase ErfK/SrfK
VGKAIELDLSTQLMFVWENGQLIQNWAISTGREDKPTKQGNFKVLDKMRWAYGSGGGDTWAMPYWMGFYWAGGTENGLHGLPLINGRKEGAGSLGHPVSHGCVRSGDDNQLWLYNWAEIGMPVIVHK